MTRKDGLHAAIVGWGKCLPPAVLTNADLATFLETDDEWIASRTGMRERRISHCRWGRSSTWPPPGRWPAPGWRPPSST